MNILPLTVTDAVLSRRGKTILDGASATFDGAGLTAVMGPNGAGKTSLLRVLHGLDRLQEGKVEWATDPATAQAHQAFVFQTPVLMRRTVVENIAYPLHLRGIDKTEAISQAKDWTDRAGLTHAAKRDAATLSGGEQQKLALARALIADPRVLFLDEPTTNLDGQSTREIENLLHDTLAQGARIIMVTHNAAQAKRLADEVLFLHRGKVLEQSPVSSFFRKPKTAQAQAFLKGDIVE
ncbi:ATP-binding cassette domain-containing protein [Pseudahrensia aquimaris]|uniref:ATP-binding cassette domain-containing protein n=1 Tax=Pseudahrensia aquimaris TaxID=744461 RepID=A0ABW3FJA7_9HYPH